MRILEMNETSQRFFDMTPTDMLHAYMQAAHADEVALRDATKDMEKAHRVTAYQDMKIDFLKDMMLTACDMDDTKPDYQKSELEHKLWMLDAEVRRYARCTEQGKESYFIAVNIQRIVNDFEQCFQM